MRHNRSVVQALAIVAGLTLYVVSVAAQGPPPEPFSVAHIKDGVYWTRGGAGSNTGFVIGKDGVIVFDAKMTPDSAKEMLAAHEALCEAAPENLLRFKDVLDYLKQDLHDNPVKK